MSSLSSNKHDNLLCLAILRNKKLSFLITIRYRQRWIISNKMHLIKKIEYLQFEFINQLLVYK